MIERNEIEGQVLGSIDAAFNAEWWDHLCVETQEDIRDKLSCVWDNLFPVQQNSETSELAPQHLTTVKSEPSEICRCSNNEMWLDFKLNHTKATFNYCPSCGKLLLTA